MIRPLVHFRVRTIQRPITDTRVRMVFKKWMSLSSPFDIVGHVIQEIDKATSAVIYIM